MQCCPECGTPTERFADIRVTPEGLVTRAGESVRVRRHGVAIMEALVAAKGRTLSKWQLFEAMYPDESDQDRRTPKNLDAQLCYLRKAIAPLGLAVRNVYGFGMYLEYSQ